MTDDHSPFVSAYRWMTVGLAGYVIGMVLSGPWSDRISPRRATSIEGAR